MPRLRHLAGLMLVAFALAAATVARAEDFPSRTIRVIVGFAAGGGNDLFARLVVQKLQEQTGWTVIVENKPGAGGRLSSEYVAKQPPDGYTVLVGATGQMSIATAVIHNITYNAVTSFTPLNMIASFPLVLVVPADSPAHNVKELVAWAKAHPDKSNYGTSSPSFTIASELLKLKTGMPAVAIPFKGSNELNTCVLSGQCLFAIIDGPPSIPLVLAGKTKALAVTGSERSPLLPNVPSMAEAGYPEVDIASLQRLFRSGRHAETDRRQADRGARQGARRSARAGRSQEDGGQSRRSDRRGVPEIHRQRYRDHQGRGQVGEP